MYTAEQKYELAAQVLAGKLIKETALCKSEQPMYLGLRCFGKSTVFLQFWT